MNLVGSGHDVRQRSVMVHKVDQGSDEFAHIRFYKVRSGIDLGRQVGKICSNYFIEITMLISCIEILQTIGEQLLHVGVVIAEFLVVAVRHVEADHSGLHQRRRRADGIEVVVLLDAVHDGLRRDGDASR